MKKYSYICAAVFVLLIAAGAGNTASAATTVTLSSIRPSQGDTVVASLPAAPAVIKAAFGGKPVTFFPYGKGERIVFGVPVTEAPGRYNLRVWFADGTAAVRTLTVRKRSFVRIDLGVPKQLGISENQAVAELKSTNESLAPTLAATTTAIFFSKPFIMPLADTRRIGSTFGEIRKTGDSIVRHLGTDFTAASGTPVRAVNDGVVRKAYADPIYGNTIVIDHGQGIFSLYLHLSRMDVKENDAVIRGGTVGAVGQTGYAFAPHLHFSIKVDGVSVDPVRFINNFQ